MLIQVLYFPQHLKENIETLSKTEYRIWEILSIIRQMQWYRKKQTYQTTTKQNWLDSALRQERAVLRATTWGCCSLSGVYTLSWRPGSYTNQKINPFLVLWLLNGTYFWGINFCLETWGKLLLVKPWMRVGTGIAVTIIVNAREQYPTVCWKESLPVLYDYNLCLYFLGLD